MPTRHAGIAVHDTGFGPALLFLHAFPLDATQWDHQVAALSGRYRCLRADLWGCGDSGAPPPGVTSLDDFATSLLTALDALNVESFGVVGMSMGGYVALALLAAAPSRISALVLSSTRSSADSDTARSDRQAQAQRVLDEDSVESLVEPNVQRLLGERAQAEVHITDPMRGRIRRCTPAGVAFALRAMAARRDRTSVLPEAHVPVLVVRGDQDAVIADAESAAMAAAAPGARTAVMQCGHLPNLENHEEFSRITGDFFDTVIARG